MSPTALGKEAQFEATRLLPLNNLVMFVKDAVTIALSNREGCHKIAVVFFLRQGPSWCWSLLHDIGG